MLKKQKNIKMNQTEYQSFTTSIQKKQLIKILSFLFPSIIKLYYNVFASRIESKNGISIDGKICSSVNFNKFFWFDCDENDISLSEMDKNIALTKDEKKFSEKLIELNNQKKLKIFLGKLEEYIERNIAIENAPNIIKSFFNKRDCFDYSYAGFFSTSIDTYIFRIIIDLLKKTKTNNVIEIIKNCIDNNESIFPITQIIGYLVDSINRNMQIEIENINNENLKPIVDSVLSQIYDQQIMI